MGKIVRFVDRAERTHQFLEIAAKLTDPLEFVIARKKFGLEERKSEQIETIDIQLGIKDEFVDAHSQGLFSKF